MNFHSTHEYLLNPHHKITVALIGCGGTGTQVLSILARMELSLVALGHLGLHVVVYDDDVISSANIGRQLFSQSEIGQYKSVSLVSRFNRFYGTKWEAKPVKFGFSKKSSKDENYNIYITCVDDFDTRLKIASKIKSLDQGFHENHKLYWLDFGNTNNTGQAILGTLTKDTEMPLDCFDDWAAKYKKPRKKKSVPSCSLAEALEKQDLLINSSLANAGMQLLWQTVS